MFLYKNISLYKVSLAIITIILSAIIISCSEESDPVAPQEDHFEAIGVVLYNSGIELASILRGETNDTLHAPLGEISDHFEVKFYNEDETIIDPPGTEHQTLSWEIADTSVAEVWQHPGEEGGFEFHLKGKKVGTTTLELFVLHEGHRDFRSGLFPVKVVE
ncbi:MAG: hypothetical protein K9J16_07795 [Melioribacteraceae bacterium]|nr:hypothetical protein [Melioribacteraceae bacterium]MCF8353333.1 hypothetical protein [Melioribacteraceae bacterium]MCF8393197.1 hypothetical protein [Melioribacteraceae bacterium]MCF8419059.1 hypothetical protein [Melioribacteraceae bacterium]